MGVRARSSSLVVRMVGSVWSSPSKPKEVICTKTRGHARVDTASAASQVLQPLSHQHLHQLNLQSWIHAQGHSNVEAPSASLFMKIKMIFLIGMKLEFDVWPWERELTWQNLMTWLTLLSTSQRTTLR